MNEPLLSVVTPTRNGAQFLPEALDSVTRLGTPHEHIVVDGGSTDDTLAILRDRQDHGLSWDRSLTVGRRMLSTRAWRARAGHSSHGSTATMS